VQEDKDCIVSGVSANKQHLQDCNLYRTQGYHHFPQFQECDWKRNEQPVLPDHALICGRCAELQVNASTYFRTLERREWSRDGGGQRFPDGSDGEYMTEPFDD
jgi:hypothetical protein